MNDLMREPDLSDVLESHGIMGVADFRPPESLFIRSGTTNLHVLDWGGRGQGVMFLHGGGQSANTWELVCLQLRDRFHCYALDLRNHGMSDRADDFLEFDVLSRDLETVLQSLHLEGAVLVGMSLGGLAAMAYAAVRPGSLGLILVDVTPTITGSRRASTYEFMARESFRSLDEAVDLAAKLNPHRPRVHHRYVMGKMLVPCPDGTWRRRSGSFPGRIKSGVGNSGSAAARSHAEFKKLWDVAGAISCPVLVTYGTESNATDPSDAARLAREVRRGRLVAIPGASHTVQGDKPGLLAREIAAFITAL